MMEDELKIKIEHKIDQIVREKIEFATKAYERAIEFHQSQSRDVWRLNWFLLAILIASTSGFLYFLYGQSLPSMEQRISTELTNKLNDKFRDDKIQGMIIESVNKFTGEQVEKGYYELLDLSVAISQASWDIDALRFLAKVISNPNYPYPKFMNLAKRNYDDVRKRIKDRNYDDYDEPEYCGINADLLSQGKKSEFLSEIKGQIRERSRSSTLFCLVILWKHNSISKEEKLSVSYEVLRNTSNPFAIYYTCMKVETEGGANLKNDFLLETDEYIKWLENFK
jgi:hypothetical protein